MRESQKKSRVASDVQVVHPTIFVQLSAAFALQVFMVTTAEVSNDSLIKKCFFLSRLHQVTAISDRVTLGPMARSGNSSLFSFLILSYYCDCIVYRLCIIIRNAQRCKSAHAKRQLCL